MEHRVKRPKTCTTPSSNLLFVIRIQGKKPVHPQIQKIFKSLGLNKKFIGVFLKATQGTLALLEKVEPYVTYGLGLATMASTSTSLASTSNHLCVPQEYLSSNNDPQLMTFQSLLQSTSSILAHHQNTSNNPTAGNYADITSTTAAVNGASASILPRGD